MLQCIALPCYSINPTLFASVRVPSHLTTATVPTVYCQVPDDPSVKVFSKKKAADRTQHNLRTFSVPLRPQPSSASSSTLPSPAGPETATDYFSGAAGPGVVGTVKITVPANLPVDAGDVVDRLKCSVMAFKQVRTSLTPSSCGVFGSCGVVFTLLLYQAGTPCCLLQDFFLPALPMSKPVDRAEVKRDMGFGGAGWCSFLAFNNVFSCE